MLVNYIIGVKIMSNVEMKNTVKGNSYWNDSGAYNAEQLELYKALVPSMGEADTIHGEVLRCANRMYYEYFNNGNGNARDENYVEGNYCYCDEDDDCYCEDEYETVPNEGFLEFLEQITDNIGTKEVVDITHQIVDIILDECNRFDKESVNVYDRLIDHVVYFILTTENKPYITKG